MDPDANLKEQLELTQKVDYAYRSARMVSEGATINGDGIVGGEPYNHDKEKIDMDDVARLCELVRALDEWIKNGGFLPKAWQQKRCTARWVPGVLIQSVEDKHKPQHPGRCYLPKGHPLDPNLPNDGHVWGADEWPEFPGGQPPAPRRRTVSNEDGEDFVPSSRGERGGRGRQ